MKKTIKAWTEEIVALLDSRQDAVERGLLVIDAFQTADERSGKYTYYQNGVGWGGSDAEFGSSLAARVREGRSLTAKQLHYARKLVKKYRRQLVDVARGNLASPLEESVADRQDAILAEHLEENGPQYFDDRCADENRRDLDEHNAIFGDNYVPVEMDDEPDFEKMLEDENDRKVADYDLR
jgi:hypothetical protein